MLWKHAQIRDLEWAAWRVVEDTHFELSAAIVNPRIAYVPGAVLYIDQDFQAERMRLRNRIVRMTSDHPYRMEVFKRLIAEFPFVGGGGEARERMRLATFHLAHFFTDGPLAYAGFMASLVSRGRIYPAMRLLYLYPLYMRKARERASLGRRSVRVTDKDGRTP